MDYWIDFGSLLLHGSLGEVGVCLRHVIVICRSFGPSCLIIAHNYCRDLVTAT